MARKRFVTSEMSTDERLAQVAEENPTAALMWPWFITGLDDWGRMTASPMKIKLDIFPAFQFTSQDIEKAIQTYDKYGLVHVYSVKGKKYLAVDPNKYFKYQTYIATKKRYVDGSGIPAPPNPPWEYKFYSDSQYRLGLAKSGSPAPGVADSSQTQALSDPSPSPSPSPSSDKRSSSQPDGATALEHPEPDGNREEKAKLKANNKLYAEDTTEYKLAYLLRSEILTNLPDARVPRASPEGMAKWCAEINRMMRLDKRDPDEIAALIRWVQSDSFWRANILSPKKLRDKWETVKLQAHRKGELDDGRTNGQRSQYPRENQSEFNKIDFSQFEFKEAREAGVPKVPGPRGDPTGERGCSDMPLSGAKEA